MTISSAPTVRKAWAAITVIVALGTAASAPIVRGQGLRPMSFLDMRLMRTVETPTPSPDGKWLLYTLSTPDWKEAKSQTDIYLVSMAQGVASTRQMSYSKNRNESLPRWARDGRAFFFLSNREAPESTPSLNQIYLMRPDGGEPQRITDTKEGVRDYALGRDGRWLTYRTGKDGEEQLYRLAISGIEGAAPEQLTKHPTGIGTWKWSPDSKRIYFVSPDALDKDDKERREKKFTVNIRNESRPSASLWALDLEPVATRKLSDGTAYAATTPVISEDGKWVAFKGQSLNRYQRNITQEGLYEDVYLLDATTGRI